MVMKSEDSKFIRDLINVLGLDIHDLKSIVLRAGVGEPVTVMTEQYAKVEDQHEIIFKKYHLVLEEKAE